MNEYKESYITIRVTTATAHMLKALAGMEKKTISKIAYDIVEAAFNDKIREFAQKLESARGD